MAQIFLNVGQCGNQLGSELHSLAYNDYIIYSSKPNVSSVFNNTYGDTIVDSFFHTRSDGHLEARAILVDTEKKVISDLQHKLKKNSPWSYRIDNIVLSSSGGSGNNWAFGYCLKGKEMKNRILDLLRKECEKCDRLSGFISLGSSGGGTGSGVGCLLLQEIRDVYPNSNIVSVLVNPFSTGEVVTQNYNMVFMYPKVNETCDALLLFENDIIHKTFSEVFRMRTSGTTFTDLNKLISEQLLSVCQAVSGSRLDMYDFVSHLCPHPKFKLLTTRSVFRVKEHKRYEAPMSWDEAEKEMLRNLKNQEDGTYINKSIANLVITRGLTADKTTVSKLRSCFSYPDWVPHDSRFLHHYDVRPMLNMNRYMTVVTNSCRNANVLDKCIERAWKSFVNNAYVHHYHKYGITKDDFLESFLKTESILKAYKEISVQTRPSV